MTVNLLTILSSFFSYAGQQQRDKESSRSNRGISPHGDQSPDFTETVKMRLQKEIRASIAVVCQGQSPLVRQLLLFVSCPLDPTPLCQPFSQPALVQWE